MPLGRKLDTWIDESALDFERISELLVEYGTLCEAPECEHDPQPAWFYLQTDWSFIWICQDDFDWVAGLSNMARAQWDKALGEFMYEKFLRRSYAHQNIISGLALEESMEVRRKAERDIVKLEGAEEARSRRELRRAIRASTTKIGSPDDELLSPQQRQHQREQMGQARVGPTPQTAIKVNLLRAQLLAPNKVLVDQSSTTTNDEGKA